MNIPGQESIPSGELMDAVIELLSEAYEGPSHPPASWFVDGTPDAGLFGQLDTLSALEASKSVDGSGERGSTIASHVEHLRWSLANANGALQGEPYRVDWSSSWLVSGLSDAEWARLRDELHAEFHALRETLRGQHQLAGDFLTGVMGLIPHAAYHLGLIRQMMERVREEPKSPAQPGP